MGGGVGGVKTVGGGGRVVGGGVGWGTPGLAGTSSSKGFIERHVWFFPVVIAVILLILGILAYKYNFLKKSTMLCGCRKSRAHGN